MIKGIIITGCMFTVGNVIWPLFNEPKIFYVPLSIFIFLMLAYIKKEQVKAHPVAKLFLWYLTVLALGNIVKQVFYTEKIKQINDYVWGGMVTVWLLIELILWATRKTVHGGTK